MKTIIVAFDSLSNPESSSVKTGGDIRKEYHRMRNAGESLAGLPVVELWTSDRGFISRYLASEKQPNETIDQKKGKRK